MKILLISSYIFGYMELVVEEMRQQGHEVDVLYYEKEPLNFAYNTIGHKLISGIQKPLGRNPKKIYREKQIKQKLKGQHFDQTLMIHGHYLNNATHRFLKSISGVYKAYFFDSLTKMPAQKKIVPHFDKIYSYEPADCKNEGYSFITNFIPSTAYKSVTNDYTIFNIGGIDERFSDIQRLAAYLDAHAISKKLMLFSPKNYPHFEQIQEKLTVQDVLPYIQKCKVMLDIQRPIQEGLTFRVFEALGNEKKLITTNKSIVNYDFYDHRNILLLDVDHIHIPQEFLSQPFAPIPEPILQKYTLSSWVKKIIE